MTIMQTIKAGIATLMAGIVYPTAVLAQEAAATGAASGAPQPSALGSLVPMILVVLVFYFVAIRPQNKKFKAHREMTTALQKGDTVITAGGIEAVVTKTDGNNVMIEVEIAPGVRANIVRGTIAELVARKGEEGAKKATPIEETSSESGKKSSSKSKKTSSKTSKKAA